jgi:type II secretory pathway pseudopilin PulG
MKTHPPSRPANPRQAGYALLMVVFLASVMLIAAMVAAPSILTEGRRQKEEELVWRGEQYMRAVRLFYRKNGRFPQSLDDLSNSTNQVRYLRKAYKDPMNAEDGSWRLIYVTPTGQIIGSLKYHSLIQMAAALAPNAQPAGAVPQGGAPGVGVAPVPDPTAPGGPGDATGPPGTGPPGTGTSGQPSGDPTMPPDSQPRDLNPQGQVFGGNILGVGSKVKKASLRVYNGASHYSEWEFLWNPASEAAARGQPAVPAGGQPLQQQPQQPPQQPQDPMRP